MNTNNNTADMAGSFSGRSSRRGRLRKFFQDFYLVIILIFLYAPIVTMMILSFNDSKSRTLWGGFTTKWYTQMFESPAIMEALYNTLLIAFISALAATILGTLAAIGISSMKRTPKNIVMGINNIPILNSEIVTGISLLLTFIAFGISLGFKTILIAHITFNLPFVILSVMPKLKQTSRYTYEAALDLGAGPLQAFFKVVFPDILPGVLSGFLDGLYHVPGRFYYHPLYQGRRYQYAVHADLQRGAPRHQALHVRSVHHYLCDSTGPPVNHKFRPQGRCGQGGQQTAGRPETGGKQNDNEMAGKKRIGLILRGPGFKKGLLAAASFAIVCTVCAATYIRYASQSSNELYVYNWGEYIDESVIEEFEEETGIDVIYDLFETNEEMYPVVEAGGVAYDVVLSL